MAETEAELIQKVAAKQKELVALYGQVYAVLHRVDRKKYDDSALAFLDQALDPPDAIPSAKAIAALKAIMGSTSDDKLQLERFFPVPFDSTTSVGSLVQRRVKELGLAYPDFWPYLRTNGWSTKP